ncbi:PAS domain-containing protein [Gemmatimonadota bacterium]
MNEKTIEEIRRRYVTHAYAQLRPSPREIAEAADISLSLLEKVGKGRQKPSAHSLKMLSAPLLSGGRLQIHSGRVLKALSRIEATAAVDLAVSHWFKILIAGGATSEIFGLEPDELVGKHLDTLFEDPPTLVDRDKPDSVISWKADGNLEVGWTVVSPTDTPPRCDWYVTLLYGSEADS